mmetsp:Transcript_12193/g.50469  ORF Transcript_12193/g.50469 Transcript_12193/m.50469 type:complete len:295 (-) Transcript_12193:668-1552(-)
MKSTSHFLFTISDAFPTISDRFPASCTPNISSLLCLLSNAHSSFSPLRTCSAMAISPTVMSAPYFLQSLLNGKFPTVVSGARITFPRTSICFLYSRSKAPSDLSFSNLSKATVLFLRSFCKLYSRKFFSDSCSAFRQPSRSVPSTSLPNPTTPDSFNDPTTSSSVKTRSRTNCSLIGQSPFSTFRRPSSLPLNPFSTLSSPDSSMLVNLSSHDPKQTSPPILQISKPPPDLSQLQPSEPLTNLINGDKAGEESTFRYEPNLPSSAVNDQMVAVNRQPPCRNGGIIIDVEKRAGF